MALDKVPSRSIEGLKLRSGPKKKLFQVKEEYDVKTQESTTDQLKQLEQDTKIADQKKEVRQMYFAVREQSEQSKSWYGDQHHDFNLQQLKAYFAVHHLTTTDFEQVFEDILDDYDLLSKKLGPKTPKLDDIIRRIKANRLDRQRKLEERGRNVSKPHVEPHFITADVQDGQFSPRQERQKAVAGETFTGLQLPQRMMDGTQAEQVFITQFDQLQYIVDRMQDLDDDAKEKLRKFLEQLIALFFEGKLLEIYEITVDDQGNIVIRGKGRGGQQKTLFIKPALLGIKDFGLLQRHFTEARRQLQERVQEKLFRQEPIPVHIEAIWKKYVQVTMIGGVRAK